MRSQHTLSIRSGLALLSLFFFSQHLAAQGDKPPKGKYIIIDDIMMLSTAAKGVEPLACCPFPGTRDAVVAAGKSVQIPWKYAKVWGRDTLRIIQLEVVKAGTVVAQFTLTLKPTQKPMVMQCMKGFGCVGTWEAYPWKAPRGNYLEHTTHKFRVTPNNTNYLTVLNLDAETPITVRVNPCK